MLTDEIELTWIYILSDDKEIKSVLHKYLNNNYDILDTMKKQLYHKRLYNILEYINEYKNDIETQTKLEVYINEIYAINTILHKLTNTDINRVSMLTMKMIDYLKNKQYMNAVQARNGLLKVIRML